MTKSGFLNSQPASLQYYTGSLSIRSFDFSKDSRTKQTTATIALLPHQRPPAEPWRYWLLMAGRGAGKTLAGACWLLDQARPGRRLAILAPTFADGRDVCMEGPTGVIEVARARGMIVEAWNRSMGEARIGGASIKIFSATEPERLRGPQHHAIWGDEAGAWRYGEQTLDMALMGLRLGSDPRAIFTTTPRPTPLIRRLMDESVVTRAATYANTHLPAAFREQIVRRYANTRLGRQELDAEILDDTPGALWTRSGIEATRIRAAELPGLVRIVIGVDPSAGGVDGETGIVGAGKSAAEHGYVLKDATSSGDPAEWAPAVIRTFIELGADKIVAEKNQGGAMVEHVIRQTTVEVHGITIRGANLPIELVWASRGKHTRAEPISMLWSQGRGHYVGAWPELEDQCCTWIPGEDSPDRMDAKVWAFTDLFPNEEETGPPAAPLVGGQRRNYGAIQAAGGCRR